MKTEYAVAIATFAGIAIGGVAVQALHAQAKPRAYVVIEIDVVNQDAFFKEFVPVAVKTIMDQGGKFLAVDNIERLIPFRRPAVECRMAADSQTFRAVTQRRADADKAVPDGWA